MMNQTDAIYSYMKKYGSIEPIQALRDLGVFRLAARINDLRRKGVRVKDEWIETTSRVTGQPVRFKKYKVAE